MKQKTPKMPLNILFIEPYYGGSHKSFADGYRRYSRHAVDLLTMPARKWKWRMRGAPMWVAEHFPKNKPDVIMTSDFLDLAALHGIMKDRIAGIPTVIYFHENQLTYPISPHDRRDYQYGFTNINSCLTADRTIFNSRYHLEDFRRAADELLGKMPDCIPEDVSEKIQARSYVIPVGIDKKTIDCMRRRAARPDGPLRVVWNHRWEFDKNPAEFFGAMDALDGEGYEFKLRIMGEQFRTMPPEFEDARERLRHRIEVFGYVEDREEYLRLLLKSDVLVSTAIHEFFGIGVVEGMAAGCWPLLPDRLSYPEILPDHLHGRCLYATREELLERLRGWAADPDRVRSLGDITNHMNRFRWEEVAPQLDRSVESVAEKPVAEGSHPSAKPSARRQTL